MLLSELAHSLPLKNLKLMLISKPVTYDKVHLDSLARIDDYRGRKKALIH